MEPRGCGVEEQGSVYCRNKFVAFLVVFLHVFDSHCGDTTTFAVIMTNNGHDQQQTMPADILFVQDECHVVPLFDCCVSFLSCCVLGVSNRAKTIANATTFVAIMTKNGHDQQQTMPVCFIYVMG
jgi:hypothetical protein